MDFDFCESEKNICSKIAALFNSEAKAALAKTFTGDSLQIRDSILHWQGLLGPIGYLGLGLDDGKNNVGMVKSQEELASASPSLFLSVEYSTRLFGRLVSLYGTTDQKAEILPALKEGKIIGAVALFEGEYGIDANVVSTTGIADGDGFKVSGSKSMVVNGPIADWIAVAGTVDGKPVFFLVKKGAAGIAIDCAKSIMGYNGITAGAMTIENCLVNSKYVINLNTSFQVVGIWENQVLTAAGLGLMLSCCSTAGDYAKTTMSKGKPIITHQEVGFKLAEMQTLLETAQLLAYRAAWMSETANVEANQLAYCAKLFSVESAETVASQALQILGKHRLSPNPAEEAYLDAKYLQVAGTSIEASRMILADELLEEGRPE